MSDPKKAWPFPPSQLKHVKGIYPAPNISKAEQANLMNVCDKVWARYGLSNDARIIAWRSAMHHPKRALEIYRAILALDRLRDTR